MKSSILVAACLLALGCNTTTVVVNGGSGGTGGGTGGVDGDAGIGGTSGTGGNAGTGGTAGMGGNAGTGGTAGMGGNAGTGGTAGTGGNGGNAGTGGVGGDGGSGGNACPVIQGFTANPMVIPVGQTTADVRVVANDPDMFPEESLRILLSSETGVFADRRASDTTFTCGAPGPVKLRVTASDGDPDCDKKSEITVECPSDIPENICPQLFVLNAIPSTIPAGQISTRVESRGHDTDLLPSPLTLTMTALWGTIENDENIPQPFNVVAQNATYICDRPGEVEICVDATDGACVKTLCIEVRCPADVPASP